MNPVSRPVLATLGQFMAVRTNPTNLLFGAAVVVLVLQQLLSSGLQPRLQLWDLLHELDDSLGGLELRPAMIPQLHQLGQLLVHLVELRLYHYLERERERERERGGGGGGGGRDQLIGRVKRYIHVHVN